MRWRWITTVRQRLAVCARVRAPLASRLVPANAGIATVIAPIAAGVASSGSVKRWGRCMSFVPFLSFTGYG
jgi:hypothetical protein